MNKPVADEEKNKEQLIEELVLLREQVARMSALANSGSVHNLAYFRERLAEEVLRGSRYKYFFSMIIVEADNFAAYTKKCGSSAGNELIGMMLTILRNSLRTTDLYCHFENSRFGLLLPYTNGEGACIVADRICKTTERVMALKSMSTKVSLTASAGVASFPEDAVSGKMLEDLAGDMLNRAVDKGGNCFCYTGVRDSSGQRTGNNFVEQAGNEMLVENLDNEILRCSRFGTELSLIMMSFAEQDLNGVLITLDDKKRIMHIVDKYIAVCIRGTDKPFPYNRNRLVILLPNTRAEGAQALAKKIYQSVDESLGKDSGDTHGKLSLNMGIASFPLDEVSPSGLIRSAAAALEQAVKRGRNQSVLASSLARREGGNLRDISSWIESLREMGQSSIFNLVAVVDATEHYVVPHSQNTAKLSMAIGQALGLHTANLRRLRVVALLHDIGKVYMKAEILTKPSQLNNEELALMKKHPELGAAIIQQFPDYAFCIKAIQSHHERMDGKGYPAGLKGEEIPLESRIVAVAEAFDDMVTPRPYREQRSMKMALKELEQRASTQFDPEVVEALKKVITNAAGA